MQITELSLFQFFTGIFCLKEITGPELRRKLDEAGLSSSPTSFYQKMKRLKDGGIVEVTKRGIGAEPTKYRTSKEWQKKLRATKPHLEFLLESLR